MPQEKKISMSIDRNPVLIRVGGAHKEPELDPREGEDNQGNMKLWNQEERVFPQG